MQKASPSVHLLNANLMSNAEPSAASTAASAVSSKPFSISVSWLIAGASFRVPWPSA